MGTSYNLPFKRIPRGGCGIVAASQNYCVEYSTIKILCGWCIPLNGLDAIIYNQLVINFRIQSVYRKTTIGKILHPRVARIFKLFNVFFDLLFSSFQFFVNKGVVLTQTFSVMSPHGDL